MRWLKKTALWKRILLGVIVGLAVGFISPKAADFLSPLGDIFLRLLKMLIVPLVFFTITSGICKMGNIKQLRTVGLSFVAWIAISAIIAASSGVVVGLMCHLGTGINEFLATPGATKPAEYNFIDNVVSWVPTNIVEAMSTANMLQIIFFSLFLGIALLSLGDRVKTLVAVIDQGSDAMLKITEYVMEYSPIGIMSLMATMVTTVSGAMMKEILIFLLADNICAAILLLICYPLIIKYFAKINAWHFMKKISPTILVALSTTSSAATLPVSLKLAGEELGIPENIYGFTLPLGNTTGMSGFALFIGLCCVFASNLFGIPITLSSIIEFVFLGLILSIGAAGVKGAGIVMSSVLFQALGMPLSLVPIFAAIWPVIDPAHTVLNNVGDLVGTSIVARKLDKMDMRIFEK